MATEKHKALKSTNDALQAVLNRAETEFKAWQGHEAKSNAALYKTLSIAAEIAENYSKKELASVAKDNSLSYNAATDIFGFAVKLVFNGIDRNKTSAYATVLRKAKGADITSDKLANWISEEGGIEAIRKGGSEAASEAAKAIKQAALATATDTIDSGYKAGFNIPAPNKGQWKFDTNENSKTAVWFVHEAPDGSFDLLSIHTDSDLVKAIATKYGTALGSDDPAKMFIKLVSRQIAPETAESDDALQRAAEKE